MKQIEWTDAHRREARVRWRQVASEMDLAGDDWWASDTAPTWSETEHDFREAMRMSERDPDREVRRVDKLARGVLVRETVWRVQYYFDDGSRCSATGDLTREEATTARDRVEHGRARIICVTRIRRAP